MTASLLAVMEFPNGVQVRVDAPDDVLLGGQIPGWLCRWFGRGCHLSGRLRSFLGEAFVEEGHALFKLVIIEGLLEELAKIINQDLQFWD